MLKKEEDEMTTITASNREKDNGLLGLTNACILQSAFGAVD